MQARGMTNANESKITSRGNDQAAARFRSRPEPMEEEKRR